MTTLHLIELALTPSLLYLAFVLAITRSKP